MQVKNLLFNFFHNILLISYFKVKNYCLSSFADEFEKFQIKFQRNEEFEEASDICLSISSVNFFEDLEENFVRKPTRDLLNVSRNYFVGLFLVDLIGVWQH